MAKDLPTITIDGRAHEGGGQVLRLAVGLSAITGKAITITNIRASRPDAGLWGSHVTAIKCVEAISASEAQGVEVGSKSVVFHPARPVSSSSPPSTFDTSITSKSKKMTKNAEGFSLRNTFVNRTSTILPTLAIISPRSNGANGSSNSLQQIIIKQKSNKASFLIFQAIYPYLLARARRPTSVRITGGTNMRGAPTIDYVEQVLLPNFAQFGLPPVSVNLHRRGWDTGPYDQGDVTLDVQPLPPVVDDSKNDKDSENEADAKTPLRPLFPEIDLNRYGRGRIKGIQVTILAPDDPIIRNTGEGPGFNPHVENMPPPRRPLAGKLHHCTPFLQRKTTNRDQTKSTQSASTLSTKPTCRYASASPRSPATSSPAHRTAKSAPVSW